MSFLQPWLLAGLPLISLPLIIHLINKRRYQSIRWAAMMFLLAANRGAEPCEVVFKVADLSDGRVKVRFEQREYLSVRPRQRIGDWWRSRDTGMWDGSPQGARELNLRMPARPGR